MSHKEDEKNILHDKKGHLLKKVKKSVIEKKKKNNSTKSQNTKMKWRRVNHSKTESENKNMEKSYD